MVFRAVALAFALLVLGAAPAHAQEDFFVGAWDVSPFAGTPYAEKGHAFTITTSTFAEVKAFRDTLTGQGQQQLDNRCLGLIPGGNPPAEKFYSATFTWSGTGTVKGCLTPNGYRELYGTQQLAFAESRTTESTLGGSWHEATGLNEWVFQAERGESCGPRRARTSAVNEVRVIAVQPDVQWHKAGAPENEWYDACRDTVLQQGDEISCDPDGAITLQFADNSTVVVKNTTQLKIASFFTEGGVVRTEILLKMGEVAAQVNKSEATKSDFRIKNPTGTTSVRGTKFTVSYDPGSRTSLVSVTEGTVEFDPAAPKLATTKVSAGKEIEATMKSVSKPVSIGKAGARGGLNRRDALEKVAKAVAAARAGCGITSPRLNAYAVKEAKGGWAVAYKVEGKLKGTSKWTVKGKRATASNALARKLAKRCS